jgi:formylglycine-generating enzyme required for sulfatase activity
MKSRFRTAGWVCLWVVLTASAVSVAAEAPAYEKKASWAQTMLALRESVARADTSTAKVEMGPWYTTGALKGNGFADELFPEKGVDLKAKDEGGKALWRKTKYADGKVQQLRAPDGYATYLYRTITVAAEMPLPAGFGSDDGLVVWLNGKKLLSQDVPRGPAPDQDRLTLALKAGTNELLLKIYNRTGDHGFYFGAMNDPMAVLWDQISRDFPRECKWLQEEYPDGEYLSWLRKSDRIQTAGLVRSALEPLGKTAGRYQQQFDALAAGTDEAAMLTLYGQICRFREGLAAMKNVDLRALRMAIEDLSSTFGSRYSGGKEYLDRLAVIETAVEQGQEPAGLAEQVAKLQREALMANPLLDFENLLIVRRNTKGPNLGLPQNWQGNCALPRSGYDDEIAVISLRDSQQPLKTIHKPDKPIEVADVELHYDAGRMLFSMIGTNNRWQIWEIGVDGKGLRQVTTEEPKDVDNYDACYLPDGRIIFASTRCIQGVPCVGGGDQVANLCIMDAEGKNVRQLCFDQDHNWSPAVLNNGRVLFTRWEYSDTSHYFSRLLFHMNPDGTNQTEYYGSNSYWPNSMFYARPIPDQPSMVATIVSGHHGVPRMGELIVMDPAKGRHEADGVIQRIPGYGKKVEPVIVDALVDNSWPKFLHPYPLSEKYYLAASQANGSSLWGIYLVDVFDNRVLIRELPGNALLEPLPLRKTVRPPVIPDKVDLKRNDAVVYLSDIYQGRGLKDVPRESIKTLRIYSFHYGYPQLGGHKNVAVEGGWDVHRILGTVPVEPDGSAYFRVPANTPIAVQPLDAQGRAMQIMRSWFTAMPGENVSCVGCHEKQNMAVPAKATIASKREANEITPWYGPERGFSFKRDVQPVLNRYCVGCHDGTVAQVPDLSPKDRNGWGNFTPSYLALHPFVRRPGPESDYNLEVPMEWHAGTSELIQMLQKGHSGVVLDNEAWDRFYTWIDLNVPDHGTWSEHTNIANNFRQRRIDMRTAYANRPEDPEVIPALAKGPMEFIKPQPVVRPSAAVSAAQWPLEPARAKIVQSQAGAQTRRTIDLGDGVTMELTLIPAGSFVMGSDDGCLDESPRSVVKIDRPFWMGVCEVSNAQYRRFDPLHENGYLDQNHKDHTTRGYPLDDPSFPAIRVSWRQAAEFCRWLGSKTGEPFGLPTEAQWEWACRAGSDQAFWYGDKNADFGKFANLADVSIKLLAVTGINPQPIPNPDKYEDWIPKDARFDDGQKILCAVGQYQPSPWGLKDMHGNAWEWTASRMMPYPYSDGDGRNDAAGGDKRVVRGGSFYDRPYRATASYRLAYEPWQRVYNVSFRVVCAAELKADMNKAITKSE